MSRGSFQLGLLFFQEHDLYVLTYSTFKSILLTTIRRSHHPHLHYCRTARARERSLDESLEERWKRRRKKTSRSNDKESDDNREIDTAECNEPAITIVLMVNSRGPSSNGVGAAIRRVVQLNQIT